MTLDYKECVLSAYAESYDRRVARGRCLAAPYVYSDDGITLKCPYCGRETVRPVWETWTIDAGESADNLLAPLEPQAPLKPEDFYCETCIVHVCSTCGRWVATQEVIGEEFRYVLQAVGSIRFFAEADDIPVEALADHLLFGRVRLRDISPKRFERVVMEFLRSEWRDCEVRHVGCCGGSGDRGVDLLLITGEDEYLVQVKHHPELLERRSSAREGVKFIRELHGVLFREGKVKGVFVTSAAGFTHAAHREVQDSRQNNHGYDLVLVDRLDLNDWLCRSSAKRIPWRKCMKRGPWPTPPLGPNVEEKRMDFA